MINKKDREIKKWLKNPDFSKASKIEKNKIITCTKPVSICIKNFFSTPIIRTINLSLNELKRIARSRHIKGFKACLKRDYWVLLVSQNQ